jgi:hypothetical protein
MIFVSKITQRHRVYDFKFINAKLAVPPKSEAPTYFGFWILRQLAAREQRENDPEQTAKARARLFGFFNSLAGTASKAGRGVLSDLKKPKNVIKGEFARPGQTDWAVLCSVKGVPTILVFWDGSEKNPTAILKVAGGD